METNKIKRLELIKKKCCVGFVPHQIEHFLYVVEKTKLDPLMNQIYAMVIQGKLSILTSIDGFRLLAERGGNYSPGEDVFYEYSDEGQMVYAKCSVKKRTEDGTWHNITARAYWKEYAKEGKGGRFWAQFPHLMIAKCAEALALRKAFPQDLSGLYIKEEMDQASKDEAEFITSEQVQELSKKLSSLNNGERANIIKAIGTGNLNDIKMDKYNSICKLIDSTVKRTNGEK